MDEGVKHSSSTLGFAPDNPVSELLKKYFFDSFKPDVQYRFNIGEDDAHQNAQGKKRHAVYELVRSILKHPLSLLDNSHQLADLLYKNSNHPKIKAGEIYVAILEDIKIGNEIHKGVGIFKSENKETYLKVFADPLNGYRITNDEGINIKKLDKGAIIIDTEEESGYLISVVDFLTRENEAKFWKEDFLDLVPRADNFYLTHHFLDVCKGFVSDVFTPENHAERTEQIDLLQKSMQFFSNNDTFDVKNFENEVMASEEVIGAFQEYRANYAEEKQIPLETNFQIANEAVKRQKRFFKSVIKLDRNFHVYVHGNNELIERGYDHSKGMNYYRLYYENET